MLTHKAYMMAHLGTNLFNEAGRDGVGATDLTNAGFTTTSELAAVFGLPGVPLNCARLRFFPLAMAIATLAAMVACHTTISYLPSVVR